MGAAGLLGFAYGLLYPLPARSGVRLENERAVGSRFDLRRLRRRERPDDRRRSNMVSRTSYGISTVRMVQMQGSHRRQHHRQRQFLSEDGAGRIDRRNVPQDTRSEGDGFESRPVTPESDLGLSASDRIVPEIAAQLTSSRLDYLGNRCKFVCVGHETPLRCWSWRGTLPALSTIDAYGSGVNESR